MNGAVATIAIFLDGLLAGIFIGSSLIEHAVRQAELLPWLTYKQAKEIVLGRTMPALLAAALLFSIAAAALSSATLPFAIAAVLLIGVTSITAAVHLPLNKVMMTWHPSGSPPGWSDARSRWRTWNWARC